MTDKNKPAAIAEAVKDLRDRLENVFRSLNTILSVIMISGEALSNQGADFDPEAALVLMRCASDPLHDELKELTKIIESLGGQTTHRKQDHDVGAL